ncbi:hypothetical protein T02_9468 [Trichinella nativa]|uniref:Uncharacterized protein n=1 Tax=Trichinella nativa TaxID=6335 RepID=A0A0V1KJH4_9BILA|nr:hypothetical protein T02_9468 [Trichinella nativa]
MSGGLIFPFFKEIYPIVSDMMMFKSCHTIDEYICIMSTGHIFTLFQVFNSVISLFIMIITIRSKCYSHS